MPISRLRAGARIAAFGIFSTVLLATTAQAATLTVWWNKGYYPSEDEATKAVVKAWEKKTGNTVNLSLYSTNNINAKFISAISAGEVPDVAYADINDFLIAPQQAWKGNLVDVSSVVEPLKDQYTKTALLSSYLYNNKLHKRSYYTVPLKQQALHNFYWKPMIKAAGYSVDDIPKQWDAYWDFWGKIQKKLRADGKRVYALGFPISAVGTDNFYTFNQFALAYGAHFVNPDGTLNLTPETRKAAIATLTFIKDKYDKGLIPPGAINWQDSDNNAAFLSKQLIMTSNASLSIPVSQADDQKVYHEIGTGMQPLGPDGKKVKSLVAVKVAFIPKGAKNPDLAKDFLAFVAQPKRLDNMLKAARGRWLPVMPELIKDDPFWTNPKDPHIPVAVKQEVTGPTEPWPMAYNPAYAQVNAEEVWGKAEGDVVNNGVSPEKAVDNAFAQIKKIFSQYQIKK
ncbi:MAG TPA: ABC transporter substrate-binding protein [Pararhizobium sp.]|nr:ABC transporter substrate-binding protein [Pararhizobium sp.]